MLAIVTTHPIQYQVPLWKALAKDGTVPFEVWYLSDHGTKSTYDAEFNKSFAWDIDTLTGYPHRFLPVNTQPDVNKFSRLRLKKSVLPLYKEHNIKAVWIQGWQVLAYWQTVLQARQYGIPIWIRAETNDLHRPHWLKQFPRQLLLRQLFRRLSYFFYIGSANKRFYQQFGVPDSKLVSAPYFVDNQRFSQAVEKHQNERTLIRQQWNIPLGATCFLFCGKFVSKKHPNHLLQAVEQLITKYPATKEHIHILMVGEGELREQLSQAAQHLEVLCGRPVATFTGFMNQTEIPQAYLAADCLVLPSDAGETWGLVVNEVMACGTPAIVSDRCGCAEDLVKPLGEEFVYPFGNTEELSNRLHHFMTQSSRNGDRKCLALVSGFDIRQSVDAIKATYKKLTVTT